MRLKIYINENILVENEQKKAKNKSGTIYALAKSERNPEQYVVWKHKKNYKLGQMMGSWGFIKPDNKMSFQDSQKYAKEGLPYDDALALFNKMLKGKAK